MTSLAIGKNMVTQVIIHCANVVPLCDERRLDFNMMLFVDTARDSAFFRSVSATSHLDGCISYDFVNLVGGILLEARILHKERMFGSS